MLCSCFFPILLNLSLFNKISSTDSLKQNNQTCSEILKDEFRFLLFLMQKTQTKYKVVQIILCHVSWKVQSLEVDYPSSWQPT